jgi:hypothetical protein
MRRWLGISDAAAFLGEPVDELRQAAAGSATAPQGGLRGMIR